jgi:hypothetical protein
MFSEASRLLVSLARSSGRFWNVLVAIVKIFRKLQTMVVASEVLSNGQLGEFIGSHQSRASQCRPFGSNSPIHRAAIISLAITRPFLS